MNIAVTDATAPARSDLRRVLPVVLTRTFGLAGVLTTRLARDDRFRIVYEDAVAAVFVRRSAGDFDRR